MCVRAPCRCKTLATRPTWPSLLSVCVRARVRACMSEWMYDHYKKACTPGCRLRGRENERGRDRENVCACARVCGCTTIIRRHAGQAVAYERVCVCVRVQMYDHYKKAYKAVAYERQAIKYDRLWRRYRRYTRKAKEAAVYKGDRQRQRQSETETRDRVHVCVYVCSADQSVAFSFLFRQLQALPQQVSLGDWQTASATKGDAHTHTHTHTRTHTHTHTGARAHTRTHDACL